MDSTKKKIYIKEENRIINFSLNQKLKKKIKNITTAGVSCITDDSDSIETPICAICDIG